MGRCLKITAGLLLLVQAFQLAALQDPTNSPRRTINRDYLRALAKKTAGSPNTAITEEEMEYDPGSDGNKLYNEYSSGIASGSMTVDEEENRGQDKRAKKTSGDVTIATTTAAATVAPALAPALATTVATTVALTVPSNVTANQTGLPKATMSTTPDASNTSRINATEAKMEFHNSTTMAMTTQNSTSHLSAENSTSLSVTSNHTDLQTNTTTPESNDTQEFTTKGMGLTNATESTNTTTPTATTTRWINETSTMSETTNTTAASTTPEKANGTDKGAASGSSSDRGLSTETHRGQRHGAWGAVLGTAVAVVLLGVVAYMILKRKHQKGFSHSKLVDDFPSDPVLRLDNSAPLDLNFGLGGSAYYNPGLQGDNIHMSSFPGRK